MTLYYNLVSDSRGKTLTLIFSDGDTVPLSPDHPRYDEVLQAVSDDEIPEEDIRRMVNIVADVGDRLQRLSERVSVVGSNILFDGDRIRTSISEHILRLLRDGDEYGWSALVNFLEKVQTNPNAHSRESLYSWIEDRNFTITQDGDLIAYKGVAIDEDGVSVSISRGTATVNGVVHKGQIPNPTGAIVEMPRSEVQHDTQIGCATGLHAGTWEYASDFARGRVLTVRINPRDVVSVPTDCEAQKMRVRRYEVMDEVDQAFSTPTYTADNNADDEYTEEEYDDEEEYYCEGCGYPTDELDLSLDNLCESCEADIEELEEDDEYDKDYPFPYLD